MKVIQIKKIHEDWMLKYEVVDIVKAGKDSNTHYSKEDIGKGIHAQYLPSNQSFNFKQDDKVFFMPNGTITREQIDMLKETYQIKRVRSAQDSDYIITNDSYFIKSLTPGNWSDQLFTKENLIIAIKKSLEFLAVGARQMEEKLIPQIEALEYDAILTNSSVFDYVVEVKPHNGGHWSNPNREAFRSCYIDYASTRNPFLIKPQNVEPLTMFIHESPKWIHEKHVLDLVKGETVFTQEMFDSLTKMINSGDEDRELAVTLFGNFTAEESMGRAAWFWYLNNEKISYTKAHKHSGFRHMKSLLKPLSIYRHSSFLEVVHSKGWLTEEILKLVIQHKIKALNDWSNTDSGFFSIENIIIKNEKLKQYNESILSI